MTVDELVQAAVNAENNGRPSEAVQFLQEAERLEAAEEREREMMVGLEEAE